MFACDHVRMGSPACAVRSAASWRWCCRRRVIREQRHRAGLLHDATRITFADRIGRTVPPASCRSRRRCRALESQAYDSTNAKIAALRRAAGRAPSVRDRQREHPSLPDDRGGVREGRIPRDHQACGDQQPLDKICGWSLFAIELSGGLNAGHSGDRCIARLWLDQPQRCMVGRPARPSSSVSERSSATRLGGVPERPITRSARTCRRSTRRCCSPRRVTPQGSSMRGLASSRRGSPVLPFSPALLILPFPGLFRFTCYYYRGAYYKAFWADPPSCGVGEPRKRLLGRAVIPADSAERSSVFPLHRVHLPVPAVVRRVAGDALAR